MAISETATRRFDLLRTIADTLEKLTTVVESGTPGAKVSMPIPIAVKVFNLDASSWQALGKRRQTLAVSVENQAVTVTLMGSRSQRREDYTFLYGLLQSRQDTRVAELLVRGGVPDGLEERIPMLAGIVEVLRSGREIRSMIPDRDWEDLSVILYEEWLSLKGSRSGLEDPRNVFTRA